MQSVAHARATQNLHLSPKFEGSHFYVAPKYSSVTAEAEFDFAIYADSDVYLDARVQALRGARSQDIHVVRLLKIC